MLKIESHVMIAALLLSSCTAAIAAQGDVWLDVHGVSYHDKAGRCYTEAGVCKKFNEFNRGVGLSYGAQDWLEVSAGYYRNSYDENTVYMSGTLKHDIPIGNFTVSPGLRLGIATGYERDCNGCAVAPLGLLVLQVQHGAARVELGAAPYRTLGINSTNLYTLSVGVRL